MALSEDESTRLGLTFITQKVTPGQHIPKGGKQFDSTPLSIEENKVADALFHQTQNSLPSLASTEPRARILFLVLISTPHSLPSAYWGPFCIVRLHPLSQSLQCH